MYFVFPALILSTSVFLSWPLGSAMTWAMEPACQGGRFRSALEVFFQKAAGQATNREQTWKQYVLSMLVFNASMFMLGYVLLSLQQVLPLNPDGHGALSPDLIFHTVASFTTNTDFQHYSGEVSLSYFSQIFDLMWLQFLSAATGIAALTALARALAGKPTLGNFYRDLLRATFLVLLPLSLILGALLLLGGVPMTFQGSVVVKTLEGGMQTIARGPVAAFEAIKQLGTNGGGFFGTNSAHPFENPSFFTNAIESLSIIMIPMASVWMFGRISKRMRHAAVIFAVMMVLLLAMVTAALHYESAPARAFIGLPIQPTANLEGKELRFGAGAAPLWGALTTATSNGSVNSMLDSFNPLTGLVLLAGMWLNVVFGGVGVGLINMFLYIIVAVFICGMMVGRTPEYFQRKVETREMKLALLALLVHPLFILGATALFATTSWGPSAVHNPGAHGFTEILYEFSSEAANNGSAFAGLSDNAVSWNLAGGIIMLVTRFIPIIFTLAIAGSLADKKPASASAGTLKTDTILFGLVMLGTVIFIGALLFLPVAVLGPIAEHLAG